MKSPINHFLWGAATSSHQVEGNNTLNDWWEAEQDGSLSHASNLACDQYHRYPEDFKLIEELGHNAHRFSLEWSRLEPREGRWDEQAFKHYENMLNELIDKGIEPIVTLHHFTNPIWLSRKGGWAYEGSVKCFNRYVAEVVSRFKSKVRIWITINEPIVYLYQSYFAGIWPPKQKSFESAATVLKNMLSAHNQAYGIIHKIYQRSELIKPWVSFAKHATYLEPYNKRSFMDGLSCFMREWFLNSFFLDANYSGFAFFPGIMCEILQNHHAMDFIALNYYTRHVIQFQKGGEGGIFGEQVEPNEERVKSKNSLNWDICPEGLGVILEKLRKYKLPIIITENGICTNRDECRAAYIEDHIRQVEIARDKKIPVQGYLYWSLVDNFEWAEGFKPRFGIIGVNYENQARNVRKSAHVLSELCRKVSMRQPLYAR